MRLALQVHRHQARKGTDPPVPYLAHVVAVSAIVLDFGGSETQAIAALLHDTIEDALCFCIAVPIRAVCGGLGLRTGLPLTSGGA